MPDNRFLDNPMSIQLILVFIEYLNSLIKYVKRNMCMTLVDLEQFKSTPSIEYANKDVQMRQKKQLSISI